MLQNEVWDIWDDVDSNICTVGQSNHNFEQSFTVGASVVGEVGGDQEVLHIWKLVIMQHWTGEKRGFVATAYYHNGAMQCLKVGCRLPKNCQARKCINV